MEDTITRARNLGREREREVEFHPPPSSLFPLIWIAHIQHRTRSDAESEDRGATRPRWKLFRQKGGSIRRLISVFDPREPIETDLRNWPHPSFSNLRNEQKEREREREKRKIDAQINEFPTSIRQTSLDILAITHKVVKKWPSYRAKASQR